MNQVNKNKDVLLLLTENYYRNWINKDLNKIRLMFSDNIILIDPTIKTAEGIESVLEINRMIFRSCEKLNIKELNIFVDHFTSTTIGEVKLFCDKKLVEVVDIFSFDENMKIKKIVAYLDTK